MVIPFSIFFFFCSTGAWTQGLYLKPLHQPFFLCVMGFFQIGSRKLLTWADFEPWLSWSLPPEELGLQVGPTGTWSFLIFMYQ
jgi:hypothetical protein